MVTGGKSEPPDTPKKADNPALEIWYFRCDDEPDRDTRKTEVPAIAPGPGSHVMAVKTEHLQSGISSHTLSVANAAMTGDSTDRPQCT